MNNKMQILTLTYNSKILKSKVVRAWDEDGENLLYKGKIVEEVLTLISDGIATIPMLKNGIIAKYSDKTKIENYKVQLTLLGVKASII